MMNQDNLFLPLLINIKNKKILIVGGGKAALLKAKGICRFTNQIVIVSPDIILELLEFPFIFLKEAYKKDMVNDYFVVYICTDNSELNASIAEECQSKNILYTICDNPKDSLFVSPAIYKEGNITIAVGTNATSPTNAMYIRDQIQDVIRKGIIKIGK